MGDFLKGCLSPRNTLNNRGNDGLGTNPNRVACNGDRKSTHHHGIGKKESPNTLDDTGEKNDSSICYLETAKCSLKESGDYSCKADV